MSEDWISKTQKRAFVLEAHHTTHIEGTQLTLRQSERILAGQKVAAARPEDAHELLNYTKAFELVVDYLEAGDPITEALIRFIPLLTEMDARPVYFPLFASTRQGTISKGYSQSVSTTTGTGPPITRPCKVCANTRWT